jgi:hypothetical protein
MSKRQRVEWIFSILSENLKPEAPNSFETGREHKLGPKWPDPQNQTKPTSMMSTTTSGRFVELYERRMRRFNLKVLSAAAVALAVTLLLMLYSW